MAFQKEPMTDKAIDMITSTFEKFEDNHINLLRRRSSALDKVYSPGWVVDKVTGDFLIAGSGVPQTLIRYYYYYNRQIFNLLIRSVYYGGVLESINSVDYKEIKNLSQDFKGNLIDAFMELEKDNQRGGKLTLGGEQ
ncbi:hypothetical protein [Acinetobacter sp. ANC 3813]|uniref:hypothetical protein n=1 Tax=Acinetobacter sp. ANC 3813 TaxID=1977873 RepID=UPI000A34ECD5|nr:hypothetical protein [Acinetobacter sp. ANC 3813]OTG89450.1 hypothetical protein B9T34_12365 [Acinetobacter sp. ANC 3813]